MTDAIGDRLKKIRRESRLSQREFAREAGIAFRTWQTIETGGNVPSGETLLKLAALGWNPGWILTGAGAKRLPAPLERSAESGAAAVVPEGEERAGLVLEAPEAGEEIHGFSKPIPKMGAPSRPLIEGALESSIAFVEEWVVRNRRSMTPELKARVVTMIYQFIIEDAEAGQPSIDTRKLGQFLRLVV